MYYHSTIHALNYHTFTVDVKVNLSCRYNALYYQNTVRALNYHTFKVDVKFNLNSRVIFWFRNYIFLHFLLLLLFWNVVKNGEKNPFISNQLQACCSQQKVLTNLKVPQNFVMLKICVGKYEAFVHMKHFASTVVSMFRHRCL